MELEYRKLSEGEIQSALEGLAGWSLVDGKLQKEFAFQAYLEGSAFGGAVGFIAERLNHHPDLSIGYKKVTVSVNTHDVGGISPYDFELARRIDALGS